jgi:hypothetical protein
MSSNSKNNNHNTGNNSTKKRKKPNENENLLATQEYLNESLPATQEDSTQQENYAIHDEKKESENKIQHFIITREELEEKKEELRKENASIIRIVNIGNNAVRIDYKLSNRQIVRGNSFGSSSKINIEPSSKKPKTQGGKRKTKKNKRKSLRRK